MSLFILFTESLGSLQESKYLLEFALKEEWLVDTDYKHIAELTEEIGGMLWRTIEGLSNES